MLGHFLAFLSLFGQEVASCCHGKALSQRSDSWSFHSGAFEEDCTMHRDLNLDDLQNSVCSPSFTTKAGECRVNHLLPLICKPFFIVVPMASTRAFSFACLVSRWRSSSICYSKKWHGRWPVSCLGHLGQALIFLWVTRIRWIVGVSWMELWLGLFCPATDLTAL